MSDHLNFCYVPDLKILYLDNYYPQMYFVSNILEEKECFASGYDITKAEPKALQKSFPGRFALYSQETTKNHRCLQRYF